MGKSVNKWIGIGNVCADIDMRYTGSGSAIANLTVACNDSYKNKESGEMVDKTEFVRVVAFGKLAEIMGEYLKKGSKVYIEGRLQTRKWQGKDGQDRYTTEIVANDMQMMDSKGQSSQAPSQPAQKPPAAAPQDDFDDDIPF